eukprot:SAG31_NODE_1230_length_9212_cov_3.669264_5_plen_75_part_00
MVRRGNLATTRTASPRANNRPGSSTNPLCGGRAGRPLISMEALDDGPHSQGVALNETITVCNSACACVSTETLA